MENIVELLHIRLVEDIIRRRRLDYPNENDQQHRKNRNWIGISIRLFTPSRELATTPEGPKLRTEMKHRNGKIIKIGKDDGGNEVFDIAFPTPNPFEFSIERVMLITRVRCRNTEDDAKQLMFCYPDDHIRVRTYINC